MCQTLCGDLRALYRRSRLASHYPWEAGTITCISQKQKLRPRKVEKSGKFPSAAKGRVSVPVGSFGLSESCMADILTLGLMGSQADSKIHYSVPLLCHLNQNRVNSGGCC